MFAAQAKQLKRKQPGSLGTFHLPNIGRGVDAMLAKSHLFNIDANLPPCHIDAQTLRKPLTSLPSKQGSGLLLSHLMFMLFLIFSRNMIIKDLTPYAYASAMPLQNNINFMSPMQTKFQGNLRLTAAAE